MSGLLRHRGDRVRPQLLQHPLAAGAQRQINALFRHRPDLRRKPAFFLDLVFVKDLGDVRALVAFYPTVDPFFVLVENRDLHRILRRRPARHAKAALPLDGHALVNKQLDRAFLFDKLLRRDLEGQMTTLAALGIKLQLSAQDRNAGKIHVNHRFRAAVPLVHVVRLLLDPRRKRFPVQRHRQHRVRHKMAAQKVQPFLRQRKPVAAH